MMKISRREFLVLAATIGMGLGPLAKKAFAKLAESSKLSGNPIPANRVIHTSDNGYEGASYDAGARSYQCHSRAV